ncbi:MAG: RNA polymerase subunit sigma-70 [Planctomycetota bacterium]|nr:MAG: RNA polymerase subunit sigma-70 [Planctomycetota bacterium]
MKSFRLAEIKQLAHELTMSPARHRLRQVSGILRVIELAECDREYPYSFVCFHVTGYRPRKGADSLLSGKDLKADLVELLDGLTATQPLPAEASQGRLYDAESLSRRFKVSTKTISRWRQRGLAGAWYALPDGKPQLGFCERAVQQFVAGNLDLVRRGSAFCVMSDAERADIVERARVLVAQTHCSLHAATLKIAEETGRAVETIRYTLRRFDRDHPEQALFDRAEQGRALDEATLVLEAYRAGDGLLELARRFGRREAEIRRLLTRGRAMELAAKPIEYISNAAFEASGAADGFGAGAGCAGVRHAAGVRKASESDVVMARTPNELPPYLQALYRTPLLSREEEASLFAAMNFALHQAEGLRGKIAADIAGTTDEQIAAVEERLEAAGRIRNRIIQANLRLVVSIAKRHLFGHPTLNLFELVSDGNLSLMRAVDKFDFARGFRFSTYATWAITRGFARSVPEELAQADRFQTGSDEMLTAAGGTEADAGETEETARAAKDAVRRTLRLLDERERVIVERHFGLCGEGGGETLDAIGRDLGISKERVRQIEMKALAKLRSGLGERGAELLAG